MQLQSQRTNPTRNSLNTLRISGAGEPTEVSVGAQFMQLDKAIAGHGLAAVCKYTQEGNAKEWELFGLKDITKGKKEIQSSCA